jgi:hypothetical protein
MALADDLRDTLDQWGLGSLSDWLISQMQNNADPLTILSELRKRPEYKARFPAMDALVAAGKKNGMPVIDESQYMQMETAYRTALANSGLPPGMFDSAADFVKLLENNVDPAEVQERVAAAKVAVDQTDPFVRGQLRSMYGIDSQALMAYALDPTKNAQYIEKVATSAMIAGLAQRQQMAADRGSWERYAQDAINQQLDQAEIVNAVANASALSTTQSRLAAIEGGQFTTNDALDITLEKNAAKILKSQQRAARERARFAGSSGVTGQTLTTGSTI